MYVAGITAMVSLAFLAAIRYGFRYVCGDFDPLDPSSSRNPMEACGNGLGCLGMVITIGLAIANFAVDIWGFKVVFGAWATWTSDWKEYNNDRENQNYCAYTPMMTAYVIAIMKVVS